MPQNHPARSRDLQQHPDQAPDLCKSGRAAHLDAVVAAELRQVQEDSILARERARDAQREAANPKPPAKPPAPPTTPRRTVASPSPPPAPVRRPTAERGGILVTAEEAELIDYLLATHPLTRKDAR